ncbi:MAG: tetratricopeptide repeat protein, partial [Phycisphaerales bacterium]
MKAVLGALILVAVAGSAVAQGPVPAPAVPDVPAAKPGFPGSPSLKDSLLAPVVARELRRLAMLEIRSLETPAGDDYVCTGHLLALADSCQTDSKEQLRRRIEAAFNAGDTAAIDALSRRLIALDPSDTLTQLRLVSLSIGRLQTAEERLSALDRLLGPAGDKLDPAVRSRLAVDAANFARERGDTQGYADRLRRAAKLDSTNKDAAILLYQFFVESSNDPVGATELLANLLLADPIDPAVHVMLRDAMLDQRAMSQALRFHNARGAVLARLGTEPAPRDLLADAIMAWYTKGAEVVLTQVESELYAMRDQRGREVAAQDPALRANADKPENIRLGLDYEMARIASAAALGRAASLQEALGDMNATVSEGLRDYFNPEQAEANLNSEQATAQVRAAVMSLLLWQLAVGPELGPIEENITGFEKLKQESPSDLLLLRAWLAFRRDDLPGAQSLLSQADPSAWGAVLAAEIAAKQGDKAAAVALFVDVNRGLPLDTLGAYAFERAKAVDPASVLPDAVGKRVAAVGDSIPKWIDRMADDARVHQSLKVTTTSTTVGPLENVQYEIALKNISQIPLALAPDRVLNSRIMFAPALEAFAGSVHTAEPEVFEIGGRLRLLPGETATLVCEPDVGVAGWMAGVWSRSPTRLRWRVIQGYEPHIANSRRPGPGCSELFTETLVRRGLAEAEQNDPDLMNSVKFASESRLQAVLYAARSSFFGLAGNGSAPPNPGGLGQALADAYSSWTPAGRAMALCILPPGSQIKELAVFDLAATAETD